MARVEPSARDGKLGFRILTKARGQKFGRPRKERRENYERLLEKWRAGEISANQAGKQLGVSHKSFLRWARENEKKSS